MKIELDGILVVEGKEDASYLSNYISSEIVTLNRFELSNKTINYLKDKKVIALLDPDEAGGRIRKRLNQMLNNIINIDIDIRKCIRGKKNGVAECEIDEILTKLRPYVIEKTQANTNIKQSDLYELGLVGDKGKREYICNRLSIGNCNSKKLYKRLVLNEISLEELRKLINEYNHGN